MIRSKIVHIAGMLLLAFLISNGIVAQDTSEIVTIRGGKSSVAVGEQVRYSAHKLNGAPYAAGLAVWRSLNEDIAAIDQDGNVRGLKPGFATIMASVGKSTSTMNLAVVASADPVAPSLVPAQPPVVQVLVIEGKRILGVEEQALLSATVNGNPAGSTSWISADPAVVSVDASGTARGLKPGKAVILASAGELSDFVTIEVISRQAQTGSTMTPPEASMSKPPSPLMPDPLTPNSPKPRPETASIADQPRPEQQTLLRWPPIETVTLPSPAATRRLPEEFVREITGNEQANKQQNQEQRMQALQALLGVLGSTAQQRGGIQSFSGALPAQAQSSQNPGVNAYTNMFNYFLNQQRSANQIPGTSNPQGIQTGQIAQQLTGLMSMYQNLQNNAANRTSQGVQSQGMQGQANPVAQQLMSLLGNYQKGVQNQLNQTVPQAVPGQDQSAQFLQAFLSLMNNIQKFPNSPGQTQAPIQQQNYQNSQIPSPQPSPQQPFNSAAPNTPYVPQPTSPSNPTTTPGVQPSTPSAEQIANLLGSLAVSLPPPKNLVSARTAYVSYQENYDRVISDFPKKLREWGRWTIVDTPDQADILLHVSQGRLNMFSNEIVVQVYDRAQRNIATISCERRISGTGGVLVNRLKKEIEKQENSKNR